MPSPQNYSILKSDLYIYKYGTTDIKHAGNAPAVTYTPQVESIEHYSSMGGVREKDAEIETTVSASMSITLDELTTRNVAMTMLGTESAFSQSAATGEVAEFTGVTVGEQFALPVGHVTNVSITDGTSGTPVTYIEGTNYTLDAAAGVITITAIPGSADDTLQVAYDVSEVPASTRKMVAMLQNTGQEYGLIAIGRNSVGKRYRLEVPRFKFTPSGGLAMVSDEIAALEAECTVLSDTSKPAYPLGRVIELP